MATTYLLIFFYLLNLFVNIIVSLYEPNIITNRVTLREKLYIYIYIYVSKFAICDKFNPDILILSF